MKQRRSTTIWIVAGLLVVSAQSLVGGVLSGNQTIVSRLSARTQHPYLLLLGMFLVLTVVFIFFTLKQGTPANEAGEQPAAPLSPDKRRRLLQRFQRDWIDDRLSQGLRAIGRVDSAIVLCPAPNSGSSSEAEVAATRRLDAPLLQIFEQTAGGQLLILGAPGTGKTNHLLELAHELVKLAEADAERPIPLIFSLPRWTLDQKTHTFAEWLEGELNSEYGVSKATSQRLVERAGILPLLDGLDEVAATSRAACIRALNDFIANNDLCQLVVCSRTVEYQDSPRINLRTAIEVQRLSRADVEAVLADPQMQAARDALRDDPELWEIIDTPLWLQVLYGAAHAPASLQERDMNPRNQLYSRYLDYALAPKPSGGERKIDPHRVLMPCLGWLAKAMMNRNQTQFACEDLDAYWLVADRLPSPVSHRAALRFLPIFVATSVVLYAMLFLPLWAVNPSRLLQAELVTAFILLVGMQLRTDPPAAPEQVTFHWEWDGNLLLNSAYCFAIVAVAWHRSGPAGGSAVGVAMVLLFSLLHGLQARELSTRSSPNSGTSRSVHHAALLTGLGWVVMAVEYAVIRISHGHVPGTVLAILQAMSLCPLLLGLNLGGTYSLVHYTTRCTLAFRRQLPLALLPFLNECSRRRLLVRQGSRYAFFHISFRNYIAGTHYANPENSEVVPQPSR